MQPALVILVPLILVKLLLLSTIVRQVLTVLLMVHGFLFQLFPSNTLQQCVDAEASCCALHPNLPWFTKTLDETTTEDMDQGTSDEDILRYK